MIKLSTSKNFSKTPNLDEYQRSLLDSTGLPWEFSQEGVSMDIDSLSDDTFLELLNAGCFTAHLVNKTSSIEDKHKAAFKVAYKYAKRFIKEDVTLSNGFVLKRSIVLIKRIGGLDLLVYPIVNEIGVDTGTFKVAWGAV